MVSRQMGSLDQALSHLNKVQEYVRIGMQSAVSVTGDLVGNDNAPSNNKVHELRDIMGQFCAMEKHLENVAVAAHDVKKESQDMPEDDSRRLVDLFDARLAELKKESANVNYEQHERFKEMDQAIWEHQNPDLPMPSASATPATQDDDLEIAMTQQEIITKCPYTGQEMKNPVRNKHCNHNYDREGIMQNIKNRRGKARCPVSGCINERPLKVEDLEDNLQLKRFIDRKKHAGGGKSKKSS